MGPVIPASINLGSQTAKIDQRGINMNIFRRPDYKSDATAFLEQLKKDHPQMEAGQREGRAILWDLELDRDAKAGYLDAKVAQKPYVYQTSNK
jgi:hypothetical protein